MKTDITTRSYMPGCLACRIDALKNELDIISNMLLKFNPTLEDSEIRAFLSFKTWIVQYNHLYKAVTEENLFTHSTWCNIKLNSNSSCDDIAVEPEGGKSTITINHQCSSFSNWITQKFDIPLRFKLDTDIETNIPKTWEDDLISMPIPKTLGELNKIPNTRKDEFISLPIPKTLGELIKRKNEIDATSNHISLGKNNEKRLQTRLGESSKANYEVITIEPKYENFEPDKQRKMTVKYNEQDDTEEIMLIEEVCNKKYVDTESKKASTIQRRVVEEEFPEDELEEIYAQVPCLKPRQPRKEEHFISTDEKENQDNIDSRWSDLKQLQSDSELHTYARAAFGNKGISDPNKCLSFQGFKRKELYKRNHIRIRTNRYHFEDIQIEKGWIKSLNVWDNIVDNTNKKRKAVEEAIGAPQAKRQKLISFDLYEKSMRKELFKRQIHTERKYIKYIVRHFKKSMEETKSFLRMYSNQREKADERVFMTEDELNSNRCVELIFRQSVQYYGDNPLRKCSDCSEMDKENISHPY